MYKKRGVSKFEKYKLKDLFLANIDVSYPIPNTGGIGVGGFQTGCAGYGYWTILAKQDDKFIDLNNMSINITTVRDSATTSYTIDYIEPLSKYYNPDEARKTFFSKQEALKEADKHYNTIHQEWYQKVEENQEEKVKTLKDM